MHMCARHIDNLLVVLRVAAVAGYSMIVDGHCGHWWYARSTSAASLHEVFCREGKGRGGRGGGQTCQPESQVSQDMIQNLAGFRLI